MRPGLSVILFGTLALAQGQDPQPGPRGMRHPAISPDGKSIAFSWHGDIWVVPFPSGEARRVTTAEPHEERPAWSPDGRRLAYVSEASGNGDIHIVDLETLKCRALTRHEADEDGPAWSPDGRWIAFESNRDPNVDLPANDRWFDVWVAPAEGGTARRVTRFGGRNPSWSEDGRWIAFDRYGSGYGDGEHDIYVVESTGGVPRLVVAGDEDSRRPVFRSGNIYYSSGGHGPRQRLVANIWRIAIQGGAALQLTGFEENLAQDPSVSRDSEVLAFEYDYELYYLALKERSPRPRKIEIRISGDPYEESRGRSESRLLDGGLKSPSWSPDSRRFVGSLESDLWLVPSEGGDAARLTEGVDEERDARWSADGRSVIYVGGPFGMPGDIYRIAAEGGRIEKITRESAVYRNPCESEDGRTIACGLETMSGSDLALIDAESGRPKQTIGAKETDETCPVLRGNRLAYLRYDSSRDRSEIVLRDLDRGTEETLFEEPGQCQYLDWSRDGKKLLYCAVDENGYSNARVLNVKDRSLVRIARDRGMSVHSPSWSPDGSMIVAEERKILRGYEEDRTSDLVVRPLDRSDQPTELRFEARRQLTRRDEMQEILLQAWGLYARSFYDPYFHGADWNRVRQKFAALALECRTRTELHALINDMIRRLRASHVHLKSYAAPPRVRTGMLGLDYEVTPEGRLRVTDVLDGGPAHWSDLKAGDTIEFDGDLDAHLTRQGEEPPESVTLDVRSEGGRSRRVELKPVSMAEIRKLKYEALMRARRDRVNELSRGRLAYHHIQLMNAAEVKRLQTAIENEFGDAEGLVLDIRDGMGGLAHWQVMSLLDHRVRAEYKETPILHMRYRNGRVIPDVFSFNPIGGTVPEEVSFKRPVVLVQNEVSRSDKEILSYAFGAAGMGFRVGSPTAGGVIGGFPNRLSDGSTVVVSVQGWFTREGMNLEGYRVPPDIHVARTLSDMHAGRDPQLDKAVEVMLAQLEGKLPLRRRETK
jgi:Tol biopolymer transport system component/C-terminal processing protease CtpA/Prc